MTNQPIAVSSSKSKSAEKCLRLRWWEYEAPSGEDGQRGWEPARLNLPLSTGSWCHRTVQGLLEPHVPLNYRQVVDGAPVFADAPQVIQIVAKGYLEDVQQRGIELGLQLDGAVEEEKFLERTIQEQAALIEAFGWAYVRVRLPRLLGEYEILAVEQEEQTPLAGDVVLQARCDAVLRRKADGRVFVYNLKTSKDPHRKSWQDQWLYDQQMMTEVLAVERRLGERVYGVIVDGFDKGERVTCWWHNLKEAKEGYSKPPAEGNEKWQRQRSRLLYGYKCEETIPGRPTMYDFEGTTRKGWGPFAVYTEDFIDKSGGWTVAPQSPVEYWINWLPIEQVESVFVTLPPVLRLDEIVDRRVRQIVMQERMIRLQRARVDGDYRHPENYADDYNALDDNFPQSAGFQCQFCWAKKICWEGADPQLSPDLFRPRTANHPEVEE